MAQLEITGSARGIINEVQALYSNLNGVNEKYKEVQQAGKSVFGEAAEDASDLTDNLKKANKEQNRYSKELELIAKQTERLKKGQKEATNPADIRKYAKEIARAEQAYKELEKAGVGGLEKVNSAASKTDRIFQNLKGAVIGAFAAAGLSKGATDFIREVSEFEAAADELSSITGAVGADLEFLKQQAVQAGVETTKGAIDTVKAFQIIASEKPELLAAKEALAAVTREAIALSEASGLELPAAAVALTGALNQFSAPADQAGRFINVLAAGSQKGAVAIPLITESLLKFGTVANKANLSIEQSTALIEALGEKGLKGAESGTQLRNILAILQKGADETNPAVVGLNTALDNLAKQNLNVTELTKKFGLESFVAADILINNRARVDELTQAVTGTSTAYEQQAVVTDNLQSSVARLRNVYGSLVLSIENGEGPIAGALKSVVDGLANFLRGLIENKEEVKSWLAVIGSAAKVIGVLLIATKAYQLTLKASNSILALSAAAQTLYSRVMVSSAATTKGVTLATRALNIAFRANPVGLVITAVLALVAAYTLLTKKSKEQIETERLLLEGKKRLTEIVKDERTESDTLFKILRDGNTTRQQQTQAINILFQKYGPYLSNIETETDLLGNLAEAQKLVNRAILEGAVARVKAEKIEAQTIALIEKQIEVEEAKRRVEEARSRPAAPSSVQQFAGVGTANAIIRDNVKSPAEQNLERLQNEAQGIAASIQNFSATIDSSFESLLENFGNVDFSTAFNAVDVQIEQSKKRLSVLEAEYNEAEGLQKESIGKQFEAERKKYTQLNKIRKEETAKFLNGAQAAGGGAAGVGTADLPGTQPAGGKQAETEDLEQKKAELRIAALKDGLEKEIELEKFRFSTLKSELEKYQIDTEEAEAQHLLNVEAIREKFRVAGEAERKAAADKETAEAEAALEREKDAFDERQKLAALEFEQRQQLAVAKFKTVARTEEEITDFTEDQEKERQIFILNQQKELLQKLVELGAGRTDIETKIFKQTIANIEGEIAAITSGELSPKDSKAKSIFSLFGLDEEKDAETIAGIKEAGSLLVGELNKLADAKVETANRAVDAAKNETEAAEDALQTEIQIAQLGFASNVDLKRRELEEKRKAEEEAIEAQRKAQKEKLILDTVTQATSLITASANIFSTLSAIPFVGIPLAIGIIATMFGAFTKAKSQAFKAAKFRAGGSGKIGKDGVVKGERHTSGGVPLEIEGGEFFRTDGTKFSVVKREMTDKHTGLLEAINNDDLRGMAGYVEEMIAGTGISPLRGKADEIETKTTQAKKLEFTHRLKVENQGLEENNRLLRKMIENEKAKDQTWKTEHHEGRTIKRFGSVVREIKK